MMAKSLHSHRLPHPHTNWDRTAPRNALSSPPTLRMGETVAMIVLSAACIRLQRSSQGVHPWPTHLRPRSDRRQAFASLPSCHRDSNKKSKRSAISHAIRRHWLP